MGIRGFFTFIDNHHDHILDVIYLNDTKLIIDANNLMHYLFAKSGISSKYGGDYYDFKLAVDSYFTNLSKCNIKPMLIFDGSLKSDDSKLRTCIRRHAERLKHCHSRVDNENDRSWEESIPLLLRKEFKEYLKANNIINITRNFEADNDIAKLANYFNCPVLTDDSDFFFYNLKKGFIALRYLNMKVLKNLDGNNYLRGFIYKKDKFKLFFPNLNSQLLAFGGTLHGNDYVQFKSLDKKMFLSRVSRKSKLSFNLEKHMKTVGILSWLSYIGNYRRAVKLVRSKYRTKDDDFWEKVENCVNEYMDTNFQTDMNIYEDLTNCYDLSTIFTKSGKTIPEWLLQRLTYCNYGKILPNTLITRRVFLSMQVENFNYESSHAVSRPIRAYIYGILLKYDNYQNDDFVEEYDRSEKNQYKFDVKPNYSVNVDLNIINMMSIEKRKEVLIRAANSHFDESLVDEEMKGVFYSIICWIGNGKPMISKLHVWTLFVSILRYFYITRDKKKPYHRKLWKYQNIPKLTNSKPFNVDFVHSIAQFQSIYLSLSWLNDLLDRPVKFLEPSCLLSGSFLYNFYKDLKEATDPYSMIKNIFGTEPDLFAIFQKFILAVSSSNFDHKK